MSRCFTFGREEGKFGSMEIRSIVSFRGRFLPDGSRILQKRGK